MDKRKKFILSIKDMVIAVNAGSKILPSVTIAQACLESADGESGLTLNCNNYFGQKAGSKWKGKTRSYLTNEYDKTQGKMVKVNAAFCLFGSFEESLKEHNAMLQRVPVYAAHGLFKCDNAEGQAKILRMAGYATDPGYPQKLMKIINEYNLTQYDVV